MLIVLCATACSTSRKATEVSSSKLQVCPSGESAHARQCSNKLGIALAQSQTSSAESRDSSAVERVEVLDTLKEVTTITIDRNDKGDTLKVVQITDRTRARNRDNVVSQKVKIVERIDTVYIQKDSVSVEDKKIGLSASTDGGSKKSGLSELFLCHDSGKPKRAWSLRSLLHRFLTYVKWIFALVCAVVVLVVVIKVCLRKW